EPKEPYRYFHGVARWLLLEVLREQERGRQALSRQPPPVSNPKMPEAPDRPYECLQRCLQGLPSHSRELLMQYYEGERGGKIENRQKLAEQMQIPLNALRIRCHRLGKKLEACVSDCPRQVGPK